MKRKLLGMLVVLTLGVGGLTLLFVSRSTGANAPAAGGAAKEEAPKAAVSRITHVTVYPDSALITREVEVPAGAGLQELVVSPLPESTIVSSLYTEPSDGLRVLTTRFRTRAVREDTREEVRKVEDEIRKLMIEQRKIQSEIQALQANMTYLAKVEDFAAASTKNATEKGKLDSQEVISLSKYLIEGRNDKLKQLTALRELELLNTEAIQFAARKLRELGSGVSRTERDAVIVVDRPNNAGGKVRLNYLVNSASWRPQYKFRAGKTSKDAVVVEYLAGIVQHTGEDWERVGMTLSTAQPMLNAAPPDLHTLMVAVQPRGAGPQGLPAERLQQELFARGKEGRENASGKGEGKMKDGADPMFDRLSVANPEGESQETLKKTIASLRAESQRSANSLQNLDATALANYAATLDQARDLVMATKKGSAGDFTGKGRKNDGPSVTYHLTTRLSVPSRHDDQVIEVAKLELEPDYFYKAIPVLTPHVYRQATLVNKSKYVLLPGEATMYHGSDFVGRMSLPLVAVGEELTVGFGAEAQLQVTRQMMDKDRKMQGGNQMLKFDYRILVSSYKNEKVKVQVWDRLPHAEKDAMNVSLLKVSPEICKDALYLREERPNNLLRWDLDITPDMKGEKALRIDYEFELALDRQATFGSFATK